MIDRRILFLSLAIAGYGCVGPAAGRAPKATASMSAPPLSCSDIPGQVRLQLLIDREGKVANAKVLDEAPQGRGFGVRALQAANRMHFTPARKDGVPVDQSMNFSVKFVLNDHCNGL
jgi:TonB family protein